MSERTIKSVEEDRDRPGVSVRYSGAATQDVYLFETFAYLWSRRWLIIATTFVCAAASVAAVLVMPSWYRADVLLAAAEERSSLPLVGQLSGLASLAGISVGGGDLAEAIAVLQSRELTADFIQDMNLLPVLFANSWDAEAGAWKTTDPEDQPDLRDGVKYFDERVRTVSQDRRTELVTLSIEWTDPELAAAWANKLAEVLNDKMRMQALAEAARNVEFLRQELNSTTAVALQQAISRLLENEMQKLMLARGNKDFAFRIIDRAQVPKTRSTPRRRLIVVLSTGIGGALCALFVLLQGVNSRRSLR